MFGFEECILFQVALYESMCWQIYSIIPYNAYVFLELFHPCCEYIIAIAVPFKKN